MLTFPLTFTSADDDAGQRLDQYLVSKLPEVSRARVQQLIARGEVLVGGSAARASLRLKGAEEIQVTGPPQAPPLRTPAWDRTPPGSRYQRADGGCQER